MVRCCRLDDSAAPDKQWQKNSLSFKQAYVAAMQQKFFQFNDALKNDAVSPNWVLLLKCESNLYLEMTNGLAISNDRTPIVDDIFKFMSSVTATPPQQPPKVLTSVHVETVIQLLQNWPSSQVFPGAAFFFSKTSSSSLPHHSD